MRIDVHAHWLPQAYIDRAAPAGVHREGERLQVGEHAIVGPGVSSELLQGSDDADRWVAALDERGVDHLIMSPSPLLYLYGAEPELAAELAAFKNDALRDLVSGRPDRLSWLATLPVQDVAASVAEVRRAAALGARGVHLATSELGPHELDDEALWPLWEVLEAERLPVSLHPNPFARSLGGQASSYVLDVFPGYLHQETLAFTRMALGGVFDDFPRLQAYLTHGGGAVPYQFGRLASACTPALGVRARRPLDEYLGNFHFDLLVEDLAARRFLVDFSGAGQLVVGDNFGAIDEVDGFAELDELGLPEADARRIAGENAAALFRIDA